MPLAWPRSGWPAVRLPSWRKRFDLVHRHVGIAEQVQQPVEQHRAVPVRQHEAVAVGPVRRLRVEAQESGEQHGGDVGHAHRHAGMAGFGLLDRIHGERAQRVGHLAKLRVARRRQRRAGGGSRGGGGGVAHYGKIVTAAARAKLATIIRARLPRHPAPGKHMAAAIITNGAEPPAAWIIGFAAAEVRYDAAAGVAGRRGSE